jgi:hypothetical protein
MNQPAFSRREEPPSLERTVIDPRRVRPKRRRLLEDDRRDLFDDRSAPRRRGRGERSIDLTRDALVNNDRSRDEDPEGSADDEDDEPAATHTAAPVCAKMCLIILRATSVSMVSNEARRMDYSMLRYTIVTMIISLSMVRQTFKSARASFNTLGLSSHCVKMHSEAQVMILSSDGMRGQRSKLVHRIH